MAYPPDLPPENRTDSTVAAGNHAQDHNTIAAALRTLLEVLGADPAGDYADLTNRLADLLDESKILDALDLADSDLSRAVVAGLARVIGDVDDPFGGRLADFVTGGWQARVPVEVWPGAEPTVTMVVDAQAAQYGLTWTANPSIALWRGVVWLMFDGNNQGGTSEGQTGQRCFVMTTTDGVTFTTPHEAFTDAAYATNPVPATGRVHFQPNLFVVDDELWCAWYDGTAGYISKLASPTGKWTSYRLEFDTAGGIHLNSVDVATTPPAGRTTTYALGGVDYLPFPSQQPTELSDGVHAMPVTFQSSVHDPAADPATPAGFWDSLKFNAVIYISADGTTVNQSAPVPSSLANPTAPPSSSWEPFVVESRTGDLYVFSRNNKMAVADAETFLVSRSRDRMTWEPVQATGLELAVTRGMGVRYGRGRWAMVHTDHPQLDPGTPSTFTVAGRLNPTVFLSRLGRDDFIGGPPFGQVRTLAPLSYPALCIGPDGRLWVLFTRDDSAAGVTRRTYLAKVDLPTREDVAYLHPGRRPNFLTIAGPSVGANPARLIFDGTAVAKTAAAFVPTGDLAIGVWHKPATTATSQALVDYRNGNTGSGFLLRPGGASLAGLNLDHGQTITAGAWQFIGYRIAVATGLVRVYTANLAATAFTTRDWFVHAITASGNPADGDTVTIAGITYTFRTTPSLTRDVLRGANSTVSLGNLVAKITAVDSATLTATFVGGAVSGTAVYVVRADRADFATSVSSAVLAAPATLPLYDGGVVAVGRKAVETSGVAGYQGEVADVQGFDATLTDAKMADVHNQSSTALGAGVIGGASASGAPAFRLTSTSSPVTWPTIDDVHPYAETGPDGERAALVLHGEAYAALELPYLRNHVELGFRLPVAPTGSDRYVIASIGSNSNPVRLYIDGAAPTLLKLNGTTVATVDPTKRTLVGFDVADGAVTMGTTVVRGAIGDRVYIGNAFPQALLDSGKLTYVHLDACRVSELRPSSTRADKVDRSEVGAASGVASLGADGKVPAAQLPAGSAGTYAQVAKNTDQAISNLSGVVAVTWDIESADTGAYHDNTTNPERFTAPATGVYSVGATIELNGLSSGSWCILRVFKNGVEQVGRARIVGDTGAGGKTIPMPTRPFALAAGDYLEFRIETNDTTSRNVRKFDGGSAAWIVRNA